MNSGPGAESWCFAWRGKAGSGGEGSWLAAWFPPLLASAKFKELPESQAVTKLKVQPLILDVGSIFT